MTTEENHSGWYFLAGVVALYPIVLFFSLEKFKSAIDFFVDVIVKIIPILILIFFLMAITNYFIRPKVLVRYLGKDSDIKGWLIAISAGVLSSGPIYMWYPLLDDLQKQGMRPALMAAFLYNRAVKIPLLPLMILYFGAVYSIALIIVMMGISILQGLSTEKLMEVKI